MPQQKDKMFEIDNHIIRRFDIQKRLGKGAYGIVWKAIDKKSKQVVAVKKIFDAFRNQTDAQRTFREIMFLQALKNHPNIVQLHSIHRAANNNDIYLGFEYMETDLHNVIKRRILKDIHKKYIMYQLFKAMKYIHSGNIIHRDLKPSNILLDIMCRCKVADFGLARSLTQIAENSLGDTDPTLTDYVATRWYRAPEILIANRRYTNGIDLWSLGCILGEIIVGKPIFPGTSTVNQVEKIMATIPSPSQDDISMVCVSGIGSSMIKNAAAANKVPLQSVLGKDVSKEATSLIKQLLIFNPVRRLTAENAIKHAYVQNFHDPNQEIVLAKDVVIPFNDDVRLSVEDYRNKLYEIMSTHHSSKQAKSISGKSKVIAPPDNLSRIPRSKPQKCATNSEPKISQCAKSNFVQNIKSDSRVPAKHNIIFNDPKCLKAASKPHARTINEVPFKEKRKLSNGKINNASFNSYSQTHGIISHSTLMQLRAVAMQ